jgi:hypothetical protein
MQDNDLEILLRSAEAESPSTDISTRLKSRIYSQLIERMQEEGPLLGLDESAATGRALCVFEKIVELSPTGEAIQAFNYCRVCHGRILGENIENPPLYWPACPYADFKKS